MSVEVRPYGVNCNIACQYCYQNPIKDAGNTTKSYDLKAIKNSILQEGRPFAMFGGEPLLVPEKDLEALFELGYKRYGRNTIQTNGTLINDQHISLFKQYSVNVGISMDGPGALNDARWMGDVSKTRKFTAKSEQALNRLLEEGIPTSLIVTLHKNNASRDKLPVLNKWIKNLSNKGLHHIRLHVLEVDTPYVRNKYALSSEENLQAFMNFTRLEEELPKGFLDVFEDIRHMMEGNDHKASCVWRACDPYTTVAVRGIEGNGQRTNCGRTNKDGIDHVKSDRPGFERYISLYHTPQSYGGCKDCRFFLMCKGQCPGTAIDGDWRNRSENCDTWIALFEYFEKRMIENGKEPLSQSPLRHEIERRMISYWSIGQNPDVSMVISEIEKSEDASIRF
ncbi:radical SAM protein [Roseivirga sp. 4D4]|uniref:radical SAM protein n=1 Tax=Roseivirga sp. 4D4 TaxID=1889784 RepID=UPI0008535D0C|nr:radical SAM protein [Roseivirga sp. 4D4]OEK00134.1 radical SAM protein [Roseivirga sp. 4D4]